MGDLDEDPSAAGWPKSIFGGMGRVRQINQIREKWNTSMSRLHPPDRPVGDGSNTSGWTKRGLIRKYSTTSPNDGERGADGRESARRSEPRHLHHSLTATDLERYRSITSWLSGNGIDIADASRVAGKNANAPVGIEAFDEVFDSLSTLERSVEKDLSLASEVSNQQQDRAAVFSEEQPLLDYLVVIAPDITDLTSRTFWQHQENVFESTVAFAVPPQCQFNAESIEHFCFPRGISVTPSRDGDQLSATNTAEDFFVLLLSGGGVQGQTVQYAFCMKGVVLSSPSGSEGGSHLVPICYCIVSQLPLITFFREILRRLLENILHETKRSDPVLSFNIVPNEHTNFADAVYRRMRACSVPERGCAATFDIFPNSETPLTLDRNNIDDSDERATLLLQWSLPLLLSCLSIDTILQILGLLLTEMKVIIVCEQLSLLSAATIGLSSMLHPLSWAGPLITILPPFLQEYMEAPVPLICGVDKLPDTFQCAKGSAIVRLCENTVALHPKDEAISEALKIPGTDALCRDLGIFTRQIKQLTSARVVPFGVDVIIRRVRRHIEQLLSLCGRLHGEDKSETLSQLSDDSLSFVGGFMRTQLYQKYRDDRTVLAPPPFEGRIESSVDLRVANVTDGHEHIECISKQNSFKSAVSALFQIAMTGVNPAYESPEVDSPISASAREDNDDPNLPLASRKHINAWGTERLEMNDAGEMSHDSVEPWEFPPPIHDSNVTPEPSALSRMDAIASARVGTDVALRVNTPIGLEYLAHDAAAVFDEVQEPPNPPVYDPYYDTDEIIDEQDREVLFCRADCNMYPPRREDRETTLTLLGTTFSESMIRSAGSRSDAALLSESSEGEDYRECHGSNEATLGSLDASTQSRDEGRHDRTGSQTTVSCIKIQRTWRDWIAQKRPISRCHNDELRASQWSPLLFDDFRVNLFQNRLGDLKEFSVLTQGVDVRKEDALGGFAPGHLHVDAELSKLVWNQFPGETGAPECAVDLRFVRRISAMDLISTEGVLATEVYSDDDVLRFVHDKIAEEFFCTLRWVTVAIQPHGACSSASIVSTTELPTPTGYSAAITVGHEESVDSSGENRFESSEYDRLGLETFKATLRSGILVEKHGKRGKPHMKILFADPSCSRLLWKPYTAEGSKKAQRFWTSDGGKAGAGYFQKSLALDNITAVLPGKQTPVFNRVSAKTADEKLCLSIIGPTRTLDIRATSREDHELLLFGITALVKSHKDALRPDTRRY